MKKILLIVIPLIFIVSVFFLLLKMNGRNMPQQMAGGAGGSVSSLVAQAKEFEAQGKLLEAKSAYAKLTEEFSSSRDMFSWQKKLEELNIKLLFSPTLIPERTATYEIKPGDALIKIAKEFKTTTELIMRSNNLTSDKIIPGKKLKVWTVPFTIFVDKSQNILLLKTEDEIIKSYVVSTGLNNSTPVGTFKIINKLPNPTWFKAGAVVAPGSPENVLGTRWLGFNMAGYGIHGTVEPEKLGQQVTQGCVRMLNADVEELYAIVPVDTEVTIVD
ncbi:MAG: L,D-transpeptidase family protein [Candidatus Omnitrophota bacterium]